MPINEPYRTIRQLPGSIPVFPLLGALLLPRGDMPFNIFEPRYLTMVSDALSGTRVIGMVQPDPDSVDNRHPPLMPVGCLGRITSFSETGDGRCLITLTGVARFRVAEELKVTTPYRQVRADYSEFGQDLDPRAGEKDVDRGALLRTLRAYLEENDLKVADWSSVERAPLEDLINALAMTSPFGPREKQAFLEAPDLKARADLLVALAEMDIAKTGGGDNNPSLQ
ncbi:ATP-dependent protease [Agaricicola taiwanensis]|uniref:ATP-dependent protease n=1 Tax=Agaricicola taiwanensis TaxID=591372 RepID=A0A8J2VIS3_9RHOB|nr:LON peptidase substrate-binding domain-containing protein [Agaricicola taiwanensis]GGE27927.1 ATP-dependent protease [Agaricicola taiwanensis]